MKATISKICIVVIILFAIVAIFYQQQVQYFLPTPIPANYQPIALEQPLYLEGLTTANNAKPILLHFFNPHCPCSRFNMDHFNFLVKTYGEKVDFYLVLQTQDIKEGERDIKEEVKNRFDLSIPIIVDTNKALAQVCGVYSTPQAVLLSKEGKLFYRGNYNKSRYCISTTSNYAQQALEAILKGTPSPQFDQLAIRAYGCQLPDTTINLSSFLFPLE